MCVMHERGDRVGLIITGFLGQEYGWCMLSNALLSWMYQVLTLENLYAFCVNSIYYICCAT